MTRVPASKPALLGLALAVVGCAASPLLADDLHDHGGHHHGKHVHGEVTLNLALEGGTLIAEVESPAAQVLGFEKSPRDEAERRAVAAAEAWFRSGSGMLGVPTAAGCRLTAVEFKPPKLGGGHADYRGRYTFSCATPAALAWVEPWLLRRLQGVEKLEVNLITPGVQRQEVLGGTSQRIALR